MPFHLNKRITFALVASAALGSDAGDKLPDGYTSYNIPKNGVVLTINYRIRAGDVAYIVFQEGKSPLLSNVLGSDDGDWLIWDGQKLKLGHERENIFVIRGSKLSKYRADISNSELKKFLDSSAAGRGYDGLIEFIEKRGGAGQGDGGSCRALE